MGILSGPEILRQVALGNIVIDPMPARVNPNSVNVRLGPVLVTYDEVTLDMRRQPRETRHVIPADGFDLVPGTGYLGCTVERVSARGFAPFITGRSSVGRLFLEVEQTAGVADDGYSGRLTLELVANCLPVRVYPGVQIAQVYFLPVVGERQPYCGKYHRDLGPAGSRMWMELRGGE